jgi:PAS domain S-box-containing protein
VSKTTSPIRVRIAVAAIGTAAAAIAVSELRVHHGVSWQATAAFAPLMAVAAAMILRFRFRGQSFALEPFEAVMIPAVFALGPVAIVLTAASHLLANLFRRNEPIKTAFNVAQWSLVAGVVTVMLRALSGGIDSPRATAAFVAAIAAGAVANICMLAFVIHVAEHASITQIARRAAPTLGAGWVINAAFGFLLVLSFDASKMSVFLFAVPLALLHWGHRGYAAATTDRIRLRGMHESIRTLSEPIDPREALPRFLEQVRTCFGARAAELVLAENGGRVVHHSGENGYASRVEMAETDSLSARTLGSKEARRIKLRNADEDMQGLLVREGVQECLSAPVFDGSTFVGSLLALDRSGPEAWEDGELVVLEALAREAGTVLRKGALLTEIVEERAKLAALVDNTNDGILALDASGSVVIWNPALERITGWPAAEMHDERGLEKLVLQDEQGTRVPLYAWTHLPVDPPSDLVVETRDRGQRSLSCSFSRMTDGERGPLLIVVARDVTEARENERLKDDFVATVSHELRTPLTPILGWAETLLHAGDRITAEDRDEAIRSIRRQAIHLQQLIVNLLEVAKIERGQSLTKDGEVDVEEIVVAIVDELRAREPHRTINLELRGEAFAGRGDAVLIKQIVTNLLTNALKYAPSTEPIAVRLANTGDQIAVSVVDRGPGISAAEQERVFHRFHRLGDPLRRTQGGAGLGLYIARQLAATLDASVDLQSEVGEGSTFTLRLRTVQEKIVPPTPLRRTASR